MVLMVNNLTGFGGSGDFIVTEFSFIAATESGANTNIYTFSSASLGVADTNRHIVVVTGSDGNDGDETTAVTVAGVSATKIVQAVGPSGNGGNSAIWIAAVPTGTTGDIVVTYDAGQLASAIAVYRLVNYSATAYDTASDTTGDPSSVTIDVAADGVVIAGNLIEESVGTAVWIGVTENYDSDLFADASIHYASDKFTSAQTNMTVSCEGTSTSTEHYLVAASFRPRAS